MDFGKDTWEYVHGFPYHSAKRLSPEEPDILVNLIDGRRTSTRLYLEYLVLNFCDAEAKDVQYYFKLERVPVVDAAKKARGMLLGANCLICFGLDVLDPLCWSYHPDASTEGLPNQPHRSLRKGALQLCPFDRPGQSMLIAVGSASIYYMPNDSPVCSLAAYEQYKFNISRLICFSGSPFRWDSVSVLDDLRLFDLHAKLNGLFPSCLKIDVRPTKGVYAGQSCVIPPPSVYQLSLDNDTIHGHHHRFREREARELLKWRRAQWHAFGGPFPEVWSTEGMEVGWFTAPNGAGERVFLGYMPMRMDPVTRRATTGCDPTITGHREWRRANLYALNVFWTMNEHWGMGVLPEDVDWEAHDPEWGGDFGANSWSIEVERAYKWAARQRYPNYFG